MKVKHHTHVAEQRVWRVSSKIVLMGKLILTESESNKKNTMKLLYNLQ